LKLDLLKFFRKDHDMNNESNHSVWIYPVKDQTEENYLKQVTAMFVYSYEKEILPWMERHYPSFCEVVDDLINRTDLKGSTKKTYRSAFLWFLKSRPQASSDQQEAIAMLNDMVIPKKSLGQERPRNTVSEADLKLLIEHLEEQASTSVWAGRLLLWIPAALACGARPSEWTSVDWADSERTHIRISNSNSKVHLSEPAFKRKPKEKAEAARLLDLTIDLYDPESRVWPSEEAPGDFRRVKLIAGEDMSVQAHLDSVNLFLGRTQHIVQRQHDFKDYHAQCSCALRRACNTIWKGKKHYRLYTFRGQFSADRRALWGTEITANELGHNGPDSPSQSFYGKSSQAHSRFKGRRQSEFQVPTPRNRNRQGE